MKVAFATRDNIHINAHFGSARRVAVYDVSPEGYDFINTVEFGGNLNEDGNEDKLVPKIEALTNSDCTIVYVSAIGGSAASRLLKNNVTPIRANSEQEEITTTLNDLVKILGDPPPWLRKILPKQSKQLNFDDFDDEEE
jgi:nitrogen fixation protein NifX